MPLTLDEIKVLADAWKAGKVTAEGAAFSWGALGESADKG